MKNLGTIAETHEEAYQKPSQDKPDSMQGRQGLQREPEQTVSAFADLTNFPTTDKPRKTRKRILDITESETISDLKRRTHTFEGTIKR